MTFALAAVYVANAVGVILVVRLVRGRGRREIPPLRLVAARRPAALPQPPKVVPGVVVASEVWPPSHRVGAPAAHSREV